MVARFSGTGVTTAVVIIVLFLTVSFGQIAYAQGDPTPTPPPMPVDPAVNPATPPAPIPAKIEGKQFEMPVYPEPKVSKAMLYTQVGLNIMQLIMASMQKPPQQRQRGESVKASGCGGAGYHGQCDLFQFTNYDFPSSGNTCAQAAMATAIWTVGLTYNNSDKALAKALYAYAPPKITLGNIIELKGTLGTDWHQVNYGLDGFAKQGIKYTWVTGVPEIKKYLNMNLPVMLMLDTGTLPQYNYKWWTGHWVTAFGYDQNYIYVSNFPNNRMTWKQLDDSFKNGTLAKGHGTAGMGAVIWK